MGSVKLSETLNRRMRLQGLTLTQLARKSGVPKPTLHGWMTGRRAMNADYLRKVASVLQISIHELLFGAPDPFHSPSQEVLKELFRGDVRVTIHRIDKR
ncbi:MAG: helix-turn-helix transcriptional regulator [Bdellovibrionales bacterium]|jgi:transcriptional regulator with XRE-family HTH domain|nr:helix-turn-helix transcriptional regulator [Bdellovibrionales bacterium]